VPTITYAADGFPATLGPNLVGTHTLDVSWAEVVWAAISVGRRSLGHMAQYGVYSAFEITYRAAMIYANLREDPAGTLSRSSAYDGLDPSEKGAISYFLGMTLAKLFSHRLLNVPWLMHLDVYRQQLQPILVGKSKPDFVGLNTTYDWIVLEAKGRTNEYEESVLQSAKVQTQQLTTIQGNQPVLRVGSLAYFSAGTLQFAMRDPKGDSGREKIDDLPLVRDTVLRDYYSPFQVWLREASGVRRTKVADRSYRIVALPEFELSVGLSLEVERQLPVVKPVKEQHSSDDNEFIGSDGVLVRLGSVWSPEKMRLEPQARSRS
jgi:hypothetical protein